MNKYYILTFKIENDIDFERLKKKIDLGKDWVMLFPNVYLIKSNSNVEKWNSRLNELFTPGAYLFVEINKDNRTGRMKKYVWEWLKKNTE